MLTAVTKKLHFRCCTSPKSATGCKFENWEQIFVEKTKSNFGGIAREIYKFRMQKWCESFENACVFKVIRPLTLADKSWNYGKLSKKKQLMFRHGIAWHHKMSKSNIFNNRKHGMKATCKIFTTLDYMTSLCFCSLRFHFSPDLYLVFWAYRTNMGICNFRNGVTLPYTYWISSSFNFFLSL